ncbi:MAG: glycoside hydrolase family 3 C-terminal domain-containing protein, partial [Bacillales bacterium]|nr:glycoside hydrolase family 3 C-terminal domain-containing protein [Bacillales bacterium]
MEEKLKLLKGRDSWNFNSSEELHIQEIRVSDGPCGIREDDKRHTLFPTPIGLASTFNKELVKKVGVALGTDCARENIDILLAPGVNIVRSPLGGRTFEYFSEDPVLAGEMGLNYIKGLQSIGVGGCVKHFAVNSQETARLLVNEVVDKRALHDIYLRPFEKVIKEAKPVSIMSSYNKINGFYGSENKYLLTDVLRNKWNYKGIVISDWDSVHNHVSSIKAGLDVLMPYDNGYFDNSVLQAYQNKEIVNEVEASVKRLQTLSKMINYDTLEVDEEEQHQLAKEVARESIVLLKNDNILPLNTTDKYLVIGELFEHPVLQGGGSSHVKPSKVITPKIAFDKLKINYDYKRGYSSSTTSKLSNEFKLALKDADKYKAIIFFMGYLDKEEQEGIDKEDILLPFNQRELLDAFTDYYDNVVVIVSTGSPVQMEFVPDVPAVIQTNMLGQAGS